MQAFYFSCKMMYVFYPSREFIYASHVLNLLQNQAPLDFIAWFLVPSSRFLWILTFHAPILHAPCLHFNQFFLMLPCSMLHACTCLDISWPLPLLELYCSSSKRAIFSPIYTLVVTSSTQQLTQLLLIEISFLSLSLTRSTINFFFLFHLPSGFVYPFFLLLFIVVFPFFFYLINNVFGFSRLFWIWALWISLRGGWLLACNQLTIRYKLYPCFLFPPPISSQCSRDEEVTHIGEMSLESLRVSYGIPHHISL